MRQNVYGTERELGLLNFTLLALTRAALFLSRSDLARSFIIINASEPEKSYAFYQLREVAIVLKTIPAKK